MVSLKPPLFCLCCGSHYFTNVFIYDSPPEGEIMFGFSLSESYLREVWRCNLCGHFISIHGMDASTLYNDDYVSSNYRDQDGILDSFKRIISLPPSKSDNIGRVQRILGFSSSHFVHTPKNLALSVLDVGSGLGVFPCKMQSVGWDCTALDPDIRSVEHIRESVGVKTIHGDFMEIQNIGQFNVITFNKVLEHVENPINMLAKSLTHLCCDGFVYVEVPDGELAAIEGEKREEFFIDHPHIFSLTSLSLLSTQAGFSAQTIERIREPSGKHTLRVFLKPTN